ncbi:TPA: hypothetical protein BOS_9338 [Bos taurus]|nr:TPA: hypothetical protein BOS_9338 [Bos taurus]
MTLKQIGEKLGLLKPEGIEDFALLTAVTCFKIHAGEQKLKLKVLSRERLLSRDEKQVVREPGAAGREDPQRPKSTRTRLGEDVERPPPAFLCPHPVPALEDIAGPAEPLTSGLSRSAVSKLSSRHSSPSAAFNSKLRRTRSQFCCPKGAHVSISEFATDWVCRPKQMYDCAPLVLHIHDYTFLFRFPSLHLHFAKPSTNYQF